MNTWLTGGEVAATSRPHPASLRTMLIVAAVILAGVGFGVATYLSVIHYTHNSLACNGVGDCEYVNSSKYAEVAGVPVALLGALTYVSMIVLLIVHVYTRSSEALQIAWAIGLASFAFSIYLTGIEIWVLEAICIYCVVSASVMTGLFASLTAVLWLDDT